MYGNGALRSRFVDQSITTAGPNRLVCLLFDRLCLDIARAEQAQRDGVRDVASTNLIHAQDILTALTEALDPGVWEGAAQMAAIYRFVSGELVQANIQCDPKRTHDCLEIVQPLREIWHEAEQLAAASAPRQEPGALLSQMA